MSAFDCVPPARSSSRWLTQSSRPPSVSVQRFHLTWSCTYSPNVFIVVYVLVRYVVFGGENTDSVTGV
ncbi:hypothetical protein BamIOP4010DRAFT_6514 [Burkholderia ambifaria IOP40-10]|uniref:Uncharacterized protein n=1 Tax=Burkholderia ambifaria IOP40-10 TaxID=396596 RepID=B1FR53_9BURK|nr:hypothetical protein BamIOP4010DRAFT_6514 [Burkholderia ambifaria IOP40-10]